MEHLKNLITDRTQADVDYCAELKAKGWHGMSDAEKSEWQASMKGAYNYTDLNRVEAAAAYISERVRDFGYSLDLVTHVTWSRENLPTNVDFERYFENIAKIRALLAEHKASPPTPSADISTFGYEEANHVEQILLDMEDLLNRIAAVWLFSNDIYCGEV